MPFGQYLMNLASAYVTLGNLSRNSSNIDILFSSTPLTDSHGWDYNYLSVLLRGSRDMDFKGINQTIKIKNDFGTVNFNGTPANYHNTEALSILWYFSIFAILVTFFLLISFSEIFCRRLFSTPAKKEIEALPPPYDLFAPPTYDSLYKDGREPTTLKLEKKIEIFIVPVFGIKTPSQARSN